MKQRTPRSYPEAIKKSHLLEWFLTLVAAINCVVVVVVFAILNSPDFIADLPNLWPFPMIYFIEIITIAVICTIALWVIQKTYKSNWSIIFWISSGILLSFVILGAWTIGFFLIPAMVILLILGIRSDRRLNNDIPRNIIYFVSAGIGQSLVVFLSFIG